MALHFVGITVPDGTQDGLRNPQLRVPELRVHEIDLSAHVAEAAPDGPRAEKDQDQQLIIQCDNASIVVATDELGIRELVNMVNDLAERLALRRKS